MKAIKTITLLMGLYIVVLFAMGCDKNKCSPPKPPHPPLTIDWENYNNAYDVYWNYATDCSLVKREDEGKVIKVSGWLVQPGANLHEIDPTEYFCLTDKPDHIYTDYSVRIFVADDYSVLGLKEQVKEKFENSDLTAKCYVIGLLAFGRMQTEQCCFTSPIICITNVNDIIFE